MTNRERIENLFLKTFPVTKEDLPGLKYQGIKEWDSMAHMDLITDLEEMFDIRFASIDVIIFSSYEMGLEILQNKYGVEMDAVT